MGRPLTDKDIEEIGKAAWDETMGKDEANGPWDELDGSNKARYRDVIRDVCTYGGAQSDFEKKAAELWAEKQQEEPEEPPAPEPVDEVPLVPIAKGADLTPALFRDAINSLAAEAGGAAPKPANPPAKPAAPVKAEAPAQKKA